MPNIGTSHVCKVSYHFPPTVKLRSVMLANEMELSALLPYPKMCACMLIAGYAKDKHAEIFREPSVSSMRITSVFPFSSVTSMCAYG